MTVATPKRRSLVTPRGALLSLLIAGIVFTAAYPLGRYLDLRGRVNALEAEEAALDRAMTDLRRQAQVLATDEEVERLARERLGMVRPGERAFVIVPPVEPPPDAGTVDARAGAGLLGRWWHAVTQAILTPW